MTLQEAHEIQRREKMALQREVNRLNAKIAEYDAGTYVSAEKAKHLKEINRLSQENRHLTKECERYKKLWGEQININGIVRASRDKTKWEAENIQRERDEYKQLYEDTKRQLDTLLNKKDISTAELNAHISALEEALAKERSKSVTDSTNSSLPTSQTPIGHKKHIPNSRVKTGRHKGAQLGHIKHSLMPLNEEEITELENHELDCCPDCGSKCLTLLEKRSKDVIDFEIRPVKKRNLIHIYKCCDCNHMVHSPIPFRIKESAQYGNNIQALSLNLLDLGFVSINRTQEFVNGFIGNGINISQGYLCNLQRRGSRLLKTFTEDVRLACINAPVIHWDDTVIFENTKRACMRFYGNEQIALYRAHSKKDRKGLDEDAVLGALDPDTIVVHDHISMNYNKDFKYTNAECIQHLQRDLQKISDITPHEWALELKNLISETLHERNLRVAAGDKQFDSEYLKHLDVKLDRILSKAKSELKDSKGRYYENDERKLIRRLECYRENYFLWTRNFSIPPTNNLSERSLRMQKTKLRVSGQYCSIKAAEYFADIRTYTETCSRNGISPFDALSRLMAGNPYSLDEVLSSGDCE